MSLRTFLSTANPENERGFTLIDLLVVVGVMGIVASMACPRGNGDFYGAVIAKKVTNMGGAEIHYDRALDTKWLTTGNYTMSAFSWRSF